MEEGREDMPRVYRDWRTRPGHGCVEVTVTLDTTRDVVYSLDRFEA